MSVDQLGAREKGSEYSLRQYIPTTRGQGTPTTTDGASSDTSPRETKLSMTTMGTVRYEKKMEEVTDWREGCNNRKNG